VDISGDANLDTITGVDSTSAVTTVIVVAKSLVALPAVTATSNLTSPTTSVETNIFDANNRIEKRTVYVSADLPRVAFVSPDSLRVVSVPEDIPRTTYVEAA